MRSAAARAAAHPTPFTRAVVPCERRPLSTTPVKAPSPQADDDGSMSPNAGRGSGEGRRRADRTLGSALADRFELEAVLGVGGFGEVYRARDREHQDALLAIKRLRHSDAQAQYRFKREFRALCELRHRNLVRLYELFLDESGAFFTMELVQGVDYLSYVRPTGPLDGERLRKTLGELCDGVAALHASGRLHRDLKPNNVLVAEDGRVVIVDFGLATLFEAGEGLGTELGFTGTASYAAPEQLALGKIGPEADWYAVGTILYEALSGGLPYEGSFSELSEAKCRPPTALPSQPDGLDDLRALCLELLQPDPLARGGESAVRTRLGARQPAKPSSPRELVFLGRDAELETLAAMFASVERGGATIALVVAPSGQGKTALVERFLDSLRAKHRAVILRSRCYVNEELAYQAIDGCIDGLSHYLQSLPRAQAAAVLPRDTRSLARLFPVLDRVEPIASAPAVRGLEDHSSLRERAAAALRELIARLSDRAPLVLVIDDVHWDDEDSAWLLSSLCSEPDPPALFLIATCRSDLRGDSQLLRALSASRLLQELPLSALSRADTLELAVHTSPEAARDPAIAARIAAESGGHPLFALELARWSSRRTPQPDEPELSLDAAIRARAGEASAGAQRLLEIVCVAGHPLPIGLASAAAGAQLEELRELQALRLVAASGSASNDLLYVYHDRVREALLSSLPRARVLALHAGLAEALEREPNPRFDLIVEHFLEAEQPERAARYALRAADRAGDVLAFHRLPDLLTLALTDTTLAERAPLYVRLAESYALVGRTADAARAYRDAAELESDPDQRWELNSLAMWQAFQAQEFELGMGLLATLDTQSHWAARLRSLRLLYGGWYYWRWRLGREPQLMPEPSAPDKIERRRMLIAYRACTGLIGVSADLAVYFGARALTLSAKLGDKNIYAMFLTLLAGGFSVVSGRPSPRSERLLARARALTEGLTDRGAQLMVISNEAAYACTIGDFERARKLMQPVVEGSFPSTPLGGFLRPAMQKGYLNVLYWGGHVIQARSVAARAVTAARQLSDPHVEHGLRVQSGYRLLGQDDAEAAWQEWWNAQQRYPNHWAFREAIWGCLPALYAGRFDRAELAVAQAFRQFFLWHVYSNPGRTLSALSWGAVAAARLAAGEQSLRLRLRLWLATKISRLGATTPTKAQARALEAARAFINGDHELGMSHLQTARDLFVAGGMHLYAAAASYVLAELHTLEPVRAQHRAYAEEVFAREKLEHPERWVRALLPGVPEELYTAREAEDAHR